jgi:hypothetical protein
MVRAGMSLIASAYLLIAGAIGRPRCYWGQAWATLEMECITMRRASSATHPAWSWSIA